MDQQELYKVKDFDPYKVVEKKENPYEQDGRWQFAARNTLPKPPPHENVEKSYICGRGSVICWEAQSRSLWDMGDEK